MPCYLHIANYYQFTSKHCMKRGSHQLFLIGPYSPVACLTRPPLNSISPQKLNYNPHQKSWNTPMIFTIFCISSPPFPLENVASDNKNQRNSIQLVFGVVSQSSFCKQHCFKGGGGLIGKNATKAKKVVICKEKQGCFDYSWLGLFLLVKNNSF